MTQTPQFLYTHTRNPSHITRVRLYNNQACNILQKKKKHEKSFEQVVGSSPIPMVYKCLNLVCRENRRTGGIK